MNVEARPKVLVVEDDPGLRSQLRWALSDYDVHLAEDRPSAREMLAREEPAVVVLDLGLPPHAHDATEGLALIRDVLNFRSSIKVIVASGNEDRRMALEAIRLGAYDFYPKPVDQQILRVIIDRAWNTHRLEEELRHVSELTVASPLTGLVAASPIMLKLCGLVERVAGSEVGVLLTGESGTGKDVVARAIHALSRRRSGPFVAINCAAIPETLLESELFGHEKGAFTGAIRQTEGRVEQAHGGTLFLDEIGDMPLGLQAKLLRFLQDRSIVRIGGRKSIDVDLRVVAATNQPLKTMMSEGRFREDLYYRLGEVALHVPPLRERPGDAVLIAHYLVKKLRSGLDRSVKGFTPEAVARIDSHPWPGNVRELENRVKRAIVLASGPLIGAADLDLEGPETQSPGLFPTLRQSREDAERNVVTRALSVAGNNMSEAAKLLGISRPTLYDLVRTLSIGRGSFDEQCDTPHH
jgi:two-component system, NtrC family, response regulator